MATVGFFTPVYHAGPQSLSETAQNFVEGYFDITSTSLLATVLKVISYTTVVIPAIMLAIKAYLRYTAALPLPTPSIVAPHKLPTELLALIDQAPKFAGYQIGVGTPYAGTTLTGATVRPSNLFFNALLGPDSTTLPGSGQLFAFRIPPAQIHDQIANADPAQVVEVTANGHPGAVVSRGALVNIPDLVHLYGDATYRLSYGELQSTLQSQKIYTAPLLPLAFYQALKLAMRNDNIVILPGNDGHPVKLGQLNTPLCAQLIAHARDNFGEYGFRDLAEFNSLLDLTLYQLGSLVVKSEDFRILIDHNGKIRERNPGERDAIRLINACGIRGIHSTPEGRIANRTIMTQTFRTALQAAESGYVVFPAVGMGVWGGNPDLYWRAFLDAVVQSGTPLERIFVNPGHQTTRTGGPFNGYNGQEFQIILNEYRAQNAQNPAALANLAKVFDLYDRKTDVVHLSHQLKVAYPDKIVSLFNASDPDVTLGYHVGEYVNNLNHATTTEENYTALGTNGLCFETITGVHQDPARLIQT